MAASGVLVGRGYVSIRPEFEGDWSRSVNARASSAGRSGAGAFSKAFGLGMKTVGGLAAVAVSANIKGIAASAAVLAPAMATAGTAAAALKIGLTGVGEAFKAAFADTSGQAQAAASATRAVEGAQRGLANAQRALADARVQAAERVREAQKQVADAERDLADAQREARDVQGDLNDARREAARALQDMNQQLAESRLDERDAVLRLKQAEDELKAAQSKPGTTPQELERLNIAHERAKLNLTEQRTETARLTEDTKKANKAGVEGSEQVLSVKERIADANRTVADAERDLADAQAGVAKAHQDGARQIADAQRAVADAAAAVADAQAAAAAQTSKLDQAMAKLAPNARSFVNAVRGLAPAWTAMRMSVQNRLFEGLDTSITQLGQTTIPILQRQLTATAGIWNAMAKSAMGAVSEMARSGMLEDILAGSNRAFAQFKDTPADLINAFGHLSLAAAPAFERLMGQFAGAISSFADGIAASFESGGLQEGIETAFGILSQLGTLLGNVFGVVQQIFKAASDAGGQILGVLSAVFGELERILALPAVQAQLRSLFDSVAQIVGALVPVLGALVQAVVPIMAAVAPAVAAIAQALGPVLTQLANLLGAALLPIITSLMPVVEQIGLALVQVVAAITPLLVPIAALITMIIQSLMPIVKPIVSIVTELVSALAGPLMSVVHALMPVVTLLGQIFVQVFAALQPLLAPVLTLIADLANLFVSVFASALEAVMAAIGPLVPVVTGLIEVLIAALLPVIEQLGTVLRETLAAALPPLVDALMTLMAALDPLWPVLTQIIEQVVQLGSTLLTTLLPIVPPLAKAFGMIVEAAVALIAPLVGVVGVLLESLAPVIADIAPVIAQLASVLAGALAAALPPLTDALLILVQALNPIWPLLGQIIGMVVQLGADLLMQLMPPLMELVQAGVDLLLALVPILPPLAQIIGLVVELAAGVLSWLLPPLVSLVGLLVGKFAEALSTAIGWLAGLVAIVAKVITWVTTKLGPTIRWLWSEVFRPMFQSIGDKAIWLWEKAIRPALNWIGDKAKWLWDKALRPAFDSIKRGVDAVGKSFDDAKKFIDKSWSKLQDIAKNPVKFIIETIYNKGIVPTWNKIATAFGADPLKPIALPKGFARGGVLPGMSSWRQGDDQLVPMRRGEGVYVSEAMRDPFERARLFAVNRAAMQGKSLASFQQPGFAKGGIFDWIGGAAEKGLDLAKSGVSWLKDGLKESAIAGLNAVVRPLINKISGSDSLYRDMISGIPKRMLKVIIGYSGDADNKLTAAGIGGKGYKSGLSWARTQNGKRYQWGGNGNPSWDCSGFMSAIESVIRGQKPHRRWATGAFSGKTAPGGWILNRRSPFMIGITNAGVGHTAGTINGVNVESRGGDGVVVGSRARSYKDRLFTDIYGLKYDAGGWLQPGVTAAVNATGQPEAILTANQWRGITAAAAGADGPAVFEGDLYLDSGAFMGKVHGVMNQRDQALLSTLRAGRKG